MLRLVARLGGFVAFLGGPYYLVETWGRGDHLPLALVVALLPVALLLVGGVGLVDDEPIRPLAHLGLVGCVLLLLVNGYALYQMHFVKWFPGGELITLCSIVGIGIVWAYVRAWWGMPPPSPPSWED